MCIKNAAKEGLAQNGFDLAYGGDKWGNSISANGLNSGRISTRLSSASCIPKAMKRTCGWRRPLPSTVDTIHLNVRLHAYLVPDAQLIR
jgi:hypothetical protein